MLHSRGRSAVPCLRVARGGVLQRDLEERLRAGARAEGFLDRAVVRAQRAAVGVVGRG